MTKIIKLESLPPVLLSPDARQIQVVQCHGVFDCLHIGHLRYLQQAKNYGGTLVVTITSDRFVNKGADRPIFNQYERAEMLSALTCVDIVAISDYADAGIPISIVKPDFFFKGVDYNLNTVSKIERDAVYKVGGIMGFTTTTKYSTTEIIKRLKK